MVLKIQASWIPKQRSAPSQWISRGAFGSQRCEAAADSHQRLEAQRLSLLGSEKDDGFTKMRCEALVVTCGLFHLDGFLLPSKPKVSSSL